MLACHEGHTLEYILHTTKSTQLHLFAKAALNCLCTKDDLTLHTSLLQSKLAS